MMQNKFGQIVFDETDVCDLVMQGRTLDTLHNLVVDQSVNLEELAGYIEHSGQL